MFNSVNSKNDIYIHILCGCGNSFKADEMYICYNCNKVLCRFCLNEEIEYCFCKNFCKSNQSININQAKKFKNTCDQCIECPNCSTGLVKRFVNGKFIFQCPYCYWDTSTRYLTQKESDLNKLLNILKESSTKGYLRKMYDHVLNKLKDNEGLLYDNSALKNSIIRSSAISDLSIQINKAMEFRTWDIENINEKIDNEDKEFLSKQLLKYEDNYLLDSNKTYFEASITSSFFACNFDYSDKYQKTDNIDGLKEKLRNEDIGLFTSLNQRINHVSSQNIIPNNLLPKFVDLIPKKSKRCKNCKKYIVQAEDNTKKMGQKLDLCHLFLNQFPYCYISKVYDNYLLLKFSMLDFKEFKISFIEDETSPIKLILPPDVYELSETNTKKDEFYDNEFIHSKSDRCVVLKFYIGESNRDTIRFKVKAEYVRLDNSKTIIYGVELKFKI